MRLYCICLSTCMGVACTGIVLLLSVISLLHYTIRASIHDMSLQLIVPCVMLYKRLCQQIICGDFAILPYTMYCVHVHVYTTHTQYMLHTCTGWLVYTVYIVMWLNLKMMKTNSHERYRMITLYKLITLHAITCLSPLSLSLSLSLSSQMNVPGSVSIMNVQVLYNHDTASHYTLLSSHSLLVSGVIYMYMSLYSCSLELIVTTQS